MVVELLLPVRHLSPHLAAEERLDGFTGSESNAAEGAKEAALGSGPTSQEELQGQSYPQFHV